MKKKKVEITKQTQIGEILKINPNVKEILLGFGLHCFGCPMSQMETIEQAAAAHGVELDFMLKKLNEDLEAQDKAPAKKSCGCKSKKGTK